MTEDDRSPTCEPTEPADGRSCDCGGCDAPSIGWRWFRDLREWLPACERHLRNRSVKAEHKHYDVPAPDASVEGDNG